MESVAQEGPSLDEKLKLIELANQLKRLDNFMISFKELLNVDNIRLNMPLLILVFLTKFSNKSRANSDKQAVRNVLIEEANVLPLNMSEAILANLGAYYGYKNMPRQDTNLSLSDRYFQRVSDMVQSIKFKMESYLDRFIVESCFQFAISQQPVANSFPYLRWGDESGIRPITNNSSGEIEYIVRQSPILNYNVTTIAKQGKIDRLLKELNSIHPADLGASSYILSYLLKYGTMYSKYLVEQIRSHPDRFPLEELEEILALDKKYKKPKR
jgi:hypothetical protein